MTATTARHRATFMLEVALDAANVRERLAAALREWRGTRPQLAVYQLTGLSYRQYQRVENAQSMPRWRNLEQLAERTGIDLAHVIGEDESSPATPAQAASGEQATMQRVLAELRDLRVGQDEISQRLARLEESGSAEAHGRARGA